MFCSVLIKRCASSSPKNKVPGTQYVKPVTGLRKFIGSKLYKLVDGYEKFLGKRFPKVYTLYKGFSIGTKSLASDYYEYLKISGKLLTGTHVRELSYHELMTYYKAPRDMLKVGPLVAIALLPFTAYFVLPFVYFFPKALSSQFWNIKQKADFEVERLTKRLRHSRPVFRHLQSKLEQFELIEKNESTEKCKKILYKLGSGIHPSPQEILNVKHLFEDKPYSFLHIKVNHLWHLCKLNDVVRLPLLKRRLFSRTGFIRELDLSILREGGPDKLSQEDLKEACFLRGLNPFGCKREEMVEWLTQWTTVSKELNSITLI